MPAPGISTPPEAPVTALSAGRVRGMWRAGPDGGSPSAAFLGIPFAKPPVGGLRFAAPRRPDPWEGVRDALVHGPTPKRGDSAQTLIPEPAIPGEATLNLDVFTPAPGDRGARLPVMVWIHGGGYVEGSPASPWYDGAAFTRDGIVTVNVSYRLGFDGFGRIPGAPDNRGVLDWLAALEWVQENIGAFGGDPDRVTIMGQSAGGGAVLTLLGMPAAQPLFHRAISLSGALGDVPGARARRLSARLAELAGVACTRDGFASVPEERLASLQAEAAKPDSGKALDGEVSLLREGLPWAPMIDGGLITRPTAESLGAGVGADKALLLGAADDELTMTTDAMRGRLRLVPPGLALARMGLEGRRRRAYLRNNRELRRRGAAVALGRYATDRVFRSLVARVAGARTATGVDGRTGSASTWVYAFSWASPALGWACHCLDVPFWFDCLGAPGVDRIAGSQPPQALARALHSAAVRFVDEGDPGWPAWSSAPGATAVLGGPKAPDGLRVRPDGYASLSALL